MKKKKLSVLFIALGIIAVLPISVFAVNNVKKLIGPPVVKEATDEEIERKLLEEKEEFAKTHKDDNTTSIQKYNSQEDTELQNKLKEAELRKTEMEKMIISVMNKFYPNEFPTILKQLQSREINSYNLPKLQEIDYKFYDLILNVLENETLTNEEKTSLEEFITSQTHELRKDDSLQERFEKLEIQ